MAKSTIPELSLVPPMLPAIDIFNLPVHPDADLFPMLSAEELAELAEDIAENGLREPLVIQWIEEVWTLIDGRNRREACRLVEVHPHSRVLEGDAKAYILSANIRRRHMTKGQLAMATARMYPTPARLKRANSGSIKIIEPISQQYVSHARLVLAYSRDLADKVLNGTESLADAYKEAQERKKGAESDAAKMAELQRNASDLAELVKEGLALGEAFAAWQQRKKEAEIIAKNQRDSLFRSLSEAVYGPSFFSDLETAQKVHDLLVHDGDLYKLEWSSKFAGNWKSQLARLRRSQRGLENLLAVFSAVMPDEESDDE